MSTMTAPVTHANGAMPGGFISISANGGTNGILWASTPYNNNAQIYITQGVLYAFNADTLQLLWSDKTNDARDEVGFFAKHCPPVVANGKLYVATFGPLSTGAKVASGELVVYGLLNPPKPTLTVQVANATMMEGAASLPAFTSTVTGLLSGDAIGTTLIINYSTTAATGSAPGTYPITATVSGSSASKYKIVVDPGTLTVNPATLTVEVANATMVEGSASLPAFTSSVTGLLSGDAIGTTLTINYSTTATTSSAPGTYPITVTVSGSSASKYKIVVDPGTLTITPGPVPNYSTGFAGSTLALNGGAALSGARLRLTDRGILETRSAFFPTRVNIQQFTTNFQFQLTNAHSEGFTFTIQGVGPTAIGSAAKRLGYQPIANSVAIKFDLHDDEGEGEDSTGMYLNGAQPTVPAIDLTGTGVNLHSRRPVQRPAHLQRHHFDRGDHRYGDPGVGDADLHLNIPSTVGGTTAYVGFTATTGYDIYATAIQDIVNWTYTPQTPRPPAFSTYQSKLNGGATLSGTSLLLTDGLNNEARSAFFTTPLNVQQFTAAFDFQITNPNADGMTFTIQGNGPTALGSFGAGLGYATIPKSVAVKFDLHNNAGEGQDSTGLYLNGAVPTVPAVDLTNTGINLHSGDTFHVALAYNGATLTVTITDTVTGAAATQTYTVNIPATVGASTAYFGFTGGTGNATATQTVLDWTCAAGNG